VPTIHLKEQLRKLKAGWRDTWLLIIEFAIPLFFFILTTLGSGIVFYFLARTAGEPSAAPLEVIIRIIDDDFAYALQEKFGYIAFSPTDKAAFAFTATSSCVDMSRSITVEGQSMSLAYPKIEPGSQSVNQTISDIEQKYNRSMVFIHHDGKSDFHPPAHCQLSALIGMTVLGGPNKIRSQVSDNYQSN
jgi:hypothetical protein